MNPSWGLPGYRNAKYEMELNMPLVCHIAYKIHTKFVCQGGQMS